ncbi:alpha/beta hydrolase [Salmonirosea aquatica]|uniref:alpha/beta hydrolase n=1 Tax=Salmonirosea aquatica TaxID=2654236 RepID=UPI003571766F
MMHGRGSSAQDILSLADYIEHDSIAFVAPQASQGTWYPYSFLAPIEQNEPGLSSALNVVESIVAQLHDQSGFAYEDIYLLGFSQGACLTLEYVARHPRRFGGVFGLSGGLIGPEGMLPRYEGDMAQTPVFLGCSDVDFHIPKERVLESERIFTALKANVQTKLYKNFGHTVNDDELIVVNRVIASANF